MSSCQAIANGASVTDFDAVQAMVAQAMDAWGRVDVLVNNAGILRDKSFKKMTLDDWDIVLNVHLNGTAYVTHAAWPYMIDQNYGRIVLTSSSEKLRRKFRPPLHHLLVFLEKTQLLAAW
jgi:NAD(P)-dependent dehydrogenase (short-subunit alcohol dehydrogenase family)